MKQHIFPIAAIVCSVLGIFLLVASIDDKAGPPREKFYMPQGFNPQTLEDRESPRAQLFMKVCTQCHGLPDPKTHLAKEWPGIVVRMMDRMRRTQAFSMKPVVVPENKEVDEIIAYLAAAAGSPAQ
ncbi:MAG: hypothetical protein AAB035_06135 [Nitrospirota bacterium]